MSNSNLVVEIRKLHKSYKDLLKFNVAKRELPRFKKKEEHFLDQLPVLFNITVKSLIPSNLITAEDRSFLLHNWDKTISSTLDVTTKQPVEKKLVHEKSRKFTSAHSSNPSSSSVASPPPSSSPPPSPAQSTSSAPSPTPKLKRRRLTGTTLEVPPEPLRLREGQPSGCRPREGECQPAPLHHGDCRLYRTYRGPCCRGCSQRLGLR